ncbi:MAG TPA: amidase family protein, partial [Chloroflexota bacterium]|nr:amidase family protein [Chloroflexota bacterium]
LEVIAGPDGLDPRQRADQQGDAYTRALTGHARALRLGIVEEGFGWPGASEADVDAAVREAAHAFERLGATVTSLSLPLHRHGVDIWTAIGIEGATMLMVQGNSMGTNWKGHYATDLLDVYARGRLTRADDLSETVKVVMLLGQYMQEHYHGRYYAKGQNLGWLLTQAYDVALQACDVLVMPTLPMKATMLPAPEASREETVARAFEMTVNTMPTDVTGHPALNVPCAVSGGLPVGMMLIGRRGEEATVLRAAHAFEQQVFAAPPVATAAAPG